VTHPAQCCTAPRGHILHCRNPLPTWWSQTHRRRQSIQTWVGSISPTVLGSYFTTFTLVKILVCGTQLASFLGLPAVQFLIACSLHTASNQKLDCGKACERG